MRLTESRLRQIIREERQKMGIRGLREGLGEDDPDLVPIIDALSGYLSAVEAMTQYE